MLATNIVIAFDYLAIALYWARQLRIPRSTGSTKALIGVGAASVFFLTCAHTHIDIALAMMSGEPIWEHWTNWWNVASHIAQATAGGIFAWGASRWLHVNVFDKKQYDRVIGEVVNNLNCSDSPNWPDEPERGED